MQAQQLLDKFNLKLDDLTEAERKTYFEWIDKLSKQQITLEDVKTFIPRLIADINEELSGLSEPKHFWHLMFQRRRDVYLKARLKNLLMIQDFLTAPEKAQKWVENQLSSIKPNH
jgi:hypothetical protein